MQNAIASMQRYFAGFVEPQPLPETFVGMLNEIAKLSSGYSNAHKAYIMLETRKQLDKYGKLVDKEVNYTEAMAQVFGFGTSDSRDLYEISQAVDTASKAYKDEVLDVYKSVKQYYASKLDDPNTDPKFITAVTGFVLNKYKDDPVAKQIIASEIAKDMKDPHNVLLYKMMRASGFVNIKDEIRRAPISEEQKKQLLQRVEDTEKARTPKEK